MLVRYCLTLLLILTGAAISHSQELKEVGNARSSASEKQYSFTAGEEGVYMIKVVNTQGEVASIPLKEQKLEAGANIKFKLDTKNWKNGRYHVVATLREGDPVTLRLFVNQKEVVRKPEAEKF